MATVDDFFDEVRKLQKEAEEQGRSIRLTKHDDGRLTAEIIDKIKWPQKLKLLVHDHKKECEDMDKWLNDRGIDRSSEAGRLIAGAAYEHEMVYDAYEDGRTVLREVDGHKVASGKWSETGES